MKFQNWAGSPYANNIAWYSDYKILYAKLSRFGIQGGYQFGCWCVDYLLPPNQSMLVQFVWHSLYKLFVACLACSCTVCS